MPVALRLLLLLLPLLLLCHLTVLLITQASELTHIALLKKTIGGLVEVRDLAREDRVHEAEADEDADVCDDRREEHPLLVQVTRVVADAQQVGIVLVAAEQPVVQAVAEVDEHDELVEQEEGRHDPRHARELR